MNFYINQSIYIYQFKIGSVTNSSVLQIGSAGQIQALSTLSNTGGFTGPAPEAVISGPASEPSTPLVPLHSATREKMTKKSDDNHS
ncbi:spore germination protein GerPB [Anoxybacillus rupiensis]|uniref:Spore germination protein GerPB n=1 Tax=Anoxybacteroides rupiense TaxID=311460 RepID=A0ABD5IVV7_9BACL|nr:MULTISPECIES: spore germination protein GerPB [Anoxybacillus]MDE8565661.1 spore germination protein GerPB [Anoxybacillus rupiensis]MED5051814.1 spore germination protein GerPB [Anoxybacillus rupiensis]QHC03191.1 spore gernimation protein [Anoxybacillus sp. PDR2]